MSVRSFHSVFMASAVAGAALGCYLVSLRVASERAALEEVQNRIVLAQRDIRLLQTEIGTRARLAQLERWNVRVLSLSAPTADQILGDKFQLASMIAPERRPAVDAPVILATAPAQSPKLPLTEAPEDRAEPIGELFYTASLKTPEREPAKAKAATTPPKPAEAKASASRTNAANTADADDKARDKKPKTATQPAARPARTATADPLAPLPVETSSAEGSRSAR